MKTKYFDNCTSIPDPAQDVFNSNASYGLFDSKFWYENYINTVNKQSQSSFDVVTVFSDDNYNEPVAALFTIKNFSKSSLPLFNLKSTCQLGNYYTSLYGPILNSNTLNMQDVTYSIVEELAHNQSKQNDIINFQPLDKDSDFYSYLIPAFKKHGWFTHNYFCFGNWYIKLKGMNFETYYNNHPSKLKNTYKRKWKQFEKIENKELRIITDINDLHNALDAYKAIYEKSWKSSEPYPEFMPGLINSLANNGCLRMGIIWIDNKPAAAQVWAVANNVASIFKLAYDPEFQKMSLGTLLTMKLMEHVIDSDKVNEIDYLTGDDDYKKDWMDSRRERWGIIAFNTKTLPGLIEAILQISKDYLKKLIGK